MKAAGLLVRHANPLDMYKIPITALGDTAPMTGDAAKILTASAFSTIILE